MPTSESPHLDEGFTVRPHSRHVGEAAAAGMPLERTRLTRRQRGYDCGPRNALQPKDLNSEISDREPPPNSDLRGNPRHQNQRTNSYNVLPMSPV